MRALKIAALVVGATVLSGAPVSAALVSPGETNPAVNVDANEYALPSGEVVAQNTQDFVIEYDLASLGFTSDSPQSYDATLTSSVLRDPLTQRLTFVYTWEPADEVGEAMGVGRERNTFAVESFAGFTTDMSIAAVSPWTVSRSADGATINGDSVDVGGSILPSFFITTDATEFDANGTFSGTAGTEFGGTDAEGNPGLISAQSLPFTIASTFQPITVGGNGGGNGGGNVIPLPAGVWLGLAALAGGGAFGKARRALRLV